MSKLTAVFSTLVIAALSALPISAQNSGPLTAKVVAVSCSADQILAQLNAPELPAGDLIGATDGSTAATSFTVAPVSLDVLTTQDSAIVVEDAGGEILACGAVGGILDDSGSLVLSLAEQDDSGIAGVAFLAPDAGSVNISLFVTGVDEPSAENAIQSTIGSNAVNNAAPTESSSSGQVGFTVAERQYADAISEIVGTMVDSLDRFSVLMGEPQIGDDVWSVNVVTEILIWQDLNRQINDLTPPPAFSEVHSLAVEAFGLFVAAGDDLIYGFDNFDLASLENAAINVQQATALFEEASSLTADIVSSRSQ